MGERPLCHRLPKVRFCQLQRPILCEPNFRDRPVRWIGMNERKGHKADVPRDVNKRLECCGELTVCFREQASKTRHNQKNRSIRMMTIPSHAASQKIGRTP